MISLPLEGPCTDVADELSRELGGFDCEAPLLSVRNPLDLTNWTLPVLELLMVAGAVYALVYAVRRLRRDADPTNLVLWCSSIVYLLIIEPPLYFPELFGAEESLGTSFVHNVFTIDFLYDRLPLYIVALYGALPMLAFELVRCLRVFERRGALVGAISVGVVHSCFYEVFDHLGPQLQWWLWNPDEPNNHPFFASVPMTSVTLFSAVAPAILTYAVARLVGQPTWAGRALGTGQLTWRTLVCGAVVFPAVTVVAIPFQALGGEDPRVTAQAVWLGGVLAAMWVVAIPALLQGWRSGGLGRSRFVTIFGPAYLVVIGGLWIAALPAFWGAEGGVTDEGTGVGNGPFAALCYLVGLALVVAVLGPRRRDEHPQPLSREDAGAPSGS